MKETITYSPEFECLVDLLRRATDPNNTIAQFTLAKVFQKCKNRELWKKAFSTFKKLANQNYTTVQTDAQYMLGICYENGYGITKSYPQACKWYEKACINANNDITNAISKETRQKWMEYIDELDNKKIAAAQIACMTECAENGDVDSQKWLIDLYRFGDMYIEPDYKKVAYWAEKAAENGDVRSMSKIGCMYYYGSGVETNHKKSFYWLEKASSQGDYSSAMLLGEYYKSQKQYKTAAQWYRQSTKLNIKRRNEFLSQNKAGNTPQIEL